MDFKTVIKKINSRKDEEIAEGLRSILRECVDLRRNGKSPMDDTALLKQYIESSPASTELFQLWDDNRGSYDSQVLQQVFEMLGEVIHYSDESKRKELCLLIFKKERSDLIGAFLSDNPSAINSVCILLRAIADVGPAAVQLFSQRVPIAMIRKLPEMIISKKTRYRVSRWIAAIIREDPDVSGKQVLLRPDIISALADGLNEDGLFLLNELITLFTQYILPNRSLSIRMKQSFFSWNTLSNYLEVSTRYADKAPLQQFLLDIFGDGPAALYGPLLNLDFTSHVPSMVYRMLSSLNPFKVPFERKLFITIIRSHPEVIPLLFADPKTLASSSSAVFVVSGGAVESAKSKSLINWMLEPRNSAMWLTTIDFLIEIMKLPLVLPEEASTLAVTSPEVLEESLKSWLWPMVLNRSMIIKGLTLPTQIVVEKTLQLLICMLQRLHSIVKKVFESETEAKVFLSKVHWILPGSDTLSNLFKKVITCVVKDEPFEEQKTVTVKSSESQIVVNVVSGSLEPEEDMEVEESNQSIESLVQEGYDCLRELINLYPSLITQLHIDFLPLFNSSKLFTSSSTLTLSLLGLLQLLIEAHNTSVAQTLITVRGQQKPLFLLFQAITDPQTDQHIKSTLRTLLISLFQISQVHMGLRRPELLFQILLPLLPASSCDYLHDVIQDLRNQRIRFLARSHKYGFGAPLLAHALLYSAMRPRATESVWCCYLCLQLLLLTNPECLDAVKQLIEVTLEEALHQETTTIDKESLLNGQVSDDLAQMMRTILRFWSNDCEVSGIRVVAELEMQKILHPEVAFDQVFHSLLWNDMMETQLQQLGEMSSAAYVLLLLTPLRLENCTVKESMKRVCRWPIALPESILVWLVSFTRVADDLKDLSFLEKSSLNSEALSVVAFWMLSDLQQTTIPGHLDMIQWLLNHMDDKDVEILVQFLLEKRLNLWTTPSCSHLCLAIVHRVCSLKDESKQAEHCYRSLIKVLFSHLELNYAVYSLLSLQKHLFAEEKVTLLQYLISRLDDVALTKSLLSCPSTLEIPLNSPFLQPLFDHIQSEVAARLLVASYHQLFLVGVDKESEEAKSSIQLLTPELVTSCVAHLPTKAYSQLISTILRLRPDLQNYFLRTLFQPSFDQLYLQSFADLAPLIKICLSYQTTLHAGCLKVLRGSSFYGDLLQRVVRLDATDEERDCLQLLLQMDPLFTVAVNKLDLDQLCKDSYDSSVASAAQLKTFLQLCDRQGDASSHAVRVLLLRSLQALGKRWSKEGVYDPDSGSSWDLCDELLEACISRIESLNQVAKKHSSTLVKLSKLILKNRLFDPTALSLVRCLLTALSNNENQELSSQIVLTMLEGHSNYQLIVSRIREMCVSSDDNALRVRWMRHQSHDDSLAQQFLLLIQSLLQRNPQALSTSLFHQLLSLYTCSFSATDRILRSIFVTLHQANVASLESVGYLFGRFVPATNTTNIQVPNTWLLEAVSGLRLRKSVESFPQCHAESVEPIEEEEKVTEGDESESEEEIEYGFLEELRERRESVDEVGQVLNEPAFDPSFDCVESLLSSPPELEIAEQDAVLLVDPTVYLPALHYWLNVGTVDIRTYITHGVTGYLLACLTSTNRVIRQCASCLLQRMYELVLDGTFYEQPQIRLILMKLQNSIPSPSIRLSSILASFITEALGIALRPSHALYPQIKRFFLSHSTFSLTDTPLFNQLFLTDKDDYKQMRAWCLRYLLRGLQSDQDYAILARRHILSQLQTFAVSMACDEYTQKLCVAIIQRLSAIPQTAGLLYRNVSILPWLTHLLDQAKNRVIVYAVVVVMERLSMIHQEDEGIFESNMLLAFPRLLLELQHGKPEELQGDVNRVLLPCVEVYECLCDRFNKVTKEYVLDSELEKQFFEVWCQLLQAVSEAMHAKRHGEAELLHGCELSNDDFFLLCDPELLPMDTCLERIRSSLKRLKRKIPFDFLAFQSQENLYESLFIWIVC